jgi:hypothetical protein
MGAVAISCANGHKVRGGARFCPECGVPLGVEASIVEESQEDSEARPARSGRPWLKPVIAGTLLVIVAIVAAAVLSSGGNKGTKNSAPAASAPKKQRAKPCSAYTGAKPASCIASTGLPCSSYADVKPDSCYNSVQLRARRERQRIAAAKARAAAKAEVKAQAIAAKKAAAAAAAHAAYVAAANAWHNGYYQQDNNVFWEFRDGASCQDFATNGCWHVAVITRYGCSSYVAVNANEYQGGAIIGQLLDNQGYGIPPRTVRVFELDADTSGVTARNVTIDCQ